MKKLLLYIIPLFLVFSSCDLIDSDPEDPKTGYISGFVFSSDDIPMGGVKIESGSQSVLTANDGSYFLSDVNVSDRALVKLSENATICEMFKLIRVKENDTSSCNFVVPGSGKFEKVNSSDKTISNIKGKLEIQKNTVVYEDGSEVNEDVFCTVSFISPAEENFKDRFPGEFIGVDYQGEEKDITPVSCLYAGLSTTSGKDRKSVV